MASRKQLLVAVIRLMCFSVCYVYRLGDTRPAAGLPVGYLRDWWRAAGILLASRLGQNGRNVHLLEASGLELEERSQRLYRTEIAGEPHSGAEEGRFRTFGGSSTP